ncbi:MAG: hypothetical protein ACFFDN_15135 [Candidatus Hodarchaeota archaeon]
MSISDQIKNDLQNFINKEMANGVRKDKAVIKCWIETSNILTQITKEMNVSLKKVTAALLFSF